MMSWLSYPSPLYIILIDSLYIVASHQAQDVEAPEGTASENTLFF